LRVGGDTDIEGVPDCSALETGVNLSVLYVMPQGGNATLGYDVLEMWVVP